MSFLRCYLHRLKKGEKDNNMKQSKTTIDPHEDLLDLSVIIHNIEEQIMELNCFLQRMCEKRGVTMMQFEKKDT